MYRPGKRDIAKSDRLESEMDKSARSALLYSVVCTILHLIGNTETKLSIVGINIDLKNQFILNGVFCALAISFGFFTLITMIQLLGVGWPKSFMPLSRRLFAKIRNRFYANKEYSPRGAKVIARIIYFFISFPFAFGGLLLLFVYMTGVVVTFGDFWAIINLLSDKIFSHFYT